MAQSVVDSSELLESSPEDGLEIEVVRSLTFLFMPVETLPAYLPRPRVFLHLLFCVLSAPNCPPR